MGAMITDPGPLYAFAATMGFAVLFRVPAKHLLSVGAGGGLAWWIYLATNALTSSVIFATMIAATWIGGYGELMARWTRRPATLFVTCAIIPLVPGRGIFETMVGAVRGDPLTALTHGLWTIGVAGAIASGLALVTAVMPRARTRHDNPKIPPR
jgi:uncharacterized membrane protein YjjB (DUF3815 family)